MDYDHFIAYTRIAFVIVDMETVINYLAAIKLWHAKSNFDVMRHGVHACDCTILYFVRPHIAFILFRVFNFYHAVGSSAIPKAC